MKQPHHGWSYRAGGAGALFAALLALCSPGVAASEEDPCYLAPAAAGSGSGRAARMTLLGVTLVDAAGHPLDGSVEVDGLAVGRTGHVLRVPACSRRLRVQAGDRTQEQQLELRGVPFAELRLRLDDAPAAPKAPAAPARRQPTPAATDAAAGAGPAAAASLPAGMAAIHYHRPGADYDDWGLHAWHSSDPVRNDPGQNLPGVDWGTPLPPAGRDTFGVYFLVPIRFFDDGRVNYVLHRFAEREQCGDDQSFELARAREVWVVAGECETFFSRREAAAAAARARR